MEQYIEKAIHAIGIAIALIIAACLKPMFDFFKSEKTDKKKVQKCMLLKSN